METVCNLDYSPAILHFAWILAKLTFALGLIGALFAFWVWSWKELVMPLFRTPEPVVQGKALKIIDDNEDFSRRYRKHED